MYNDLLEWNFDARSVKRVHKPLCATSCRSRCNRPFCKTANNLRSKLLAPSSTNAAPGAGSVNTVCTCPACRKENFLRFGDVGSVRNAHTDSYASSTNPRVIDDRISRNLRVRNNNRFIVQRHKRRSEQADVVDRAGLSRDLHNVTQRKRPKRTKSSRHWRNARGCLATQAQQQALRRQTLRGSSSSEYPQSRAL